MVIGEKERVKENESVYKHPLGFETRRGKKGRKEWRLALGSVG
jgi:hypothetical protein